MGYSRVCAWALLYLGVASPVFVGCPRGISTVTNAKAIGLRLNSTSIGTPGLEYCIELLGTSQNSSCQFWTL